MKVAVAYDHRGRAGADLVKRTIEALGHEYVDLGPQDEGTVDYPDFAHIAATEVAEGQVDSAILLGATGIGMDMSANKMKGVRAARCNDELDAHTARRRFDANVLCLPGDLLNETLLQKTVGAWLKTDFESRERSERQIRKIEAIEQGEDPRKGGSEHRS